jgi:hypothetical protein
VNRATAGLGLVLESETGRRREVEADMRAPHVSGWRWRVRGASLLGFGGPDAETGCAAEEEKVGWAACGVGLERKKRGEEKRKRFSIFKIHSSK